MKELLFSTKIIYAAFLIIALISCKGPPGAPGPEGPPGMDGNANVQTFLFDISSETGSNFAVDVPQLTQDVIDNDLVLGYLKTLDGTYIPVPVVRYLDSGAGRNFVDIGAEIALGKFWLYFFKPGTNAPAFVSPGNMTKLKIVIVESNSTTE